MIEPGYPKKIHSLGFPKAIEKIDAAFYDEITRKMFFFSGDKYWRSVLNNLENSFINVEFFVMALRSFLLRTMLAHAKSSNPLHDLWYHIAFVFSC